MSAKPSAADVWRMLKFYGNRRDAAERYLKKHAREINARNRSNYRKDIETSRRIKREYAARWRDKHREEYAKYQRDYYKENADELRERHRNTERKRLAHMRGILQADKRG